jgi:hypothetical protein
LTISLVVSSAIGRLGRLGFAPFKENLKGFH